LVAEKEGNRTTFTALGVVQHLMEYAERLCAGADLATVLDEATAYCLKARERIERQAA
jgi:hypothetical protein